MMAAGLALMTIGYVGHFFGRVIQATVARSREQLADESAVQYTRHPAALAGALKKIVALPLGSALHVHNRQEVAHMVLGDGIGSKRGGLLATHPPIMERIRRLDPNFRPSELERIRKEHKVHQSPQAAQQEIRGSITTASPLVAGLATAALGT